jgi:hypothetical protein
MKYTPFFPLLSLLAAASLNAADKQMVSLTDFGAVGDGIADDTAAIEKAVAYAHAGNRNANYTHQIFVPAGVYAHTGIKLNSLRGVRFVGENTSDPVKRKSELRYVGPAGAAAIEIRSCGFLNFENLYFNLNSVPGVGSLILFTANQADAEAPLSRWSNNWISFRDCVFVADANMEGDKPDQTLWIKSASSTMFEKCTFKAAGPVAIKLGADTDADPDTGAVTFANGLCSITEIRDSWITGDIVREKSYNLSLRHNQFSVRSDAPENSRLRISGDGIALNETIDSCLWDPTGVSDWDGVLIEGGKHPQRSGNLRISNSQLVGRRELIRIHRGAAVIECNRPLASGSHYRNVFVTIGTHGESVVMRANETDQYLSVNTPAAIKSTLLKDERAQPLPFLASEELAEDVHLVEGGAYVPVMKTHHKFGGEWVRVSYSLNIQHRDAEARAYGARIRVGSNLVPATARRLTLRGRGDYGILSASAVIKTPAAGSSQTVQLEVNQSDGTSNFGIVRGSSDEASSGWQVELLNH